MSNRTAIDPSGAKADRTRAAILAAAQYLFARQGFAATRLDEVASVVGLTRAGLFYYYRDKQALFDAMLKDAFGGLAARLDEVLVPDAGRVTERIERAVAAWVDEIVARPNLARLILRLVADGSHLAHGIFSDNNQLPLKFWALFEQGRRTGELKPVDDDPFQTASAVIGTSVFYVAALATLVPPGSFEPLDPKRIAAHKREALRATRHLLGIAVDDNQ
jgi:AcrR family transcriptional regulator